MRDGSADAERELHIVQAECTIRLPSPSGNHVPRKCEFPVRAGVGKP
jgi:hypothetical protein